MIIKSVPCIISLSCVIILLSGNTVWGQGKNEEYSAAKNMVYLEILGSGGYGSINYERLVFDKNNFSLAVRIGFSSYHLKDYTLRFNPDIIVPIACYAYYGNKNHVELGIGQTVSSIVSADEKDFSPGRNTHLSTIIHIGYRYQKIDGGFLLKVGYTPIIENNKRYIHWLGLSVGYAF